VREYQDEIYNAGASIAAVGLGDRYYGGAFKEELGLSFPLLIDEARVAYRAAELKVGTVFGILRPVNVAATRRARKGGHKLGRVGRNPLQLGGTFVFGPGNQDRFAHVNNTYSDFASRGDVLNALT
jgi:hypothetical protein